MDKLDDIKNLYEKFTQAESLISSFKEFIIKQNVKIQHLQDNNCRLVEEKENLANENYKLSEKIKKLENVFGVKNSQFVMKNKLMSRANFLLAEKIKSLEKEIDMKDYKLQSFQSSFVDKPAEEDLSSKDTGNCEGLLIKDSGIEYNKQLNVIKIEPEELCDTNFLSTEETETTCNTSKSQQKNIETSGLSNIASNDSHHVEVQTKLKSDELYFDSESSKIYDINSRKCKGVKINDNQITKRRYQEIQEKIFTDIQDCTAALTKNKNNFECSICKKKFATKNYLNQHKKEHDKMHQCGICQECFRSKSELDTHIRTHTGEKPYQCETCQKCFGSKAALVMHIRIHTGEKPYKCKTCNKSFVRKQHLQNHEAIHSGKRNFKCNICPDERSFKTKDALYNHMLYHYDVTSYVVSL